MLDLLMIAALSGEVAFKAQPQDAGWQVTPVVTVAHACLCRIEMELRRQGSTGSVVTQQRKVLTLSPNAPLALSTFFLSVAADDTVTLRVTVSDSGTASFTGQWSPPVRA
ncbi:curli assembly chaperone CsgC [Cronobacter turicensis]|uniref:curli assembly chaperone CsgC n=1 Tax=Cronobacter turicensis TaxID=413502 RepID=UPI0024C320BA|nr:curli assembly chaperone CsgC [Cronobacter turicensis]MDK1186204.1 curli assembly chaperone CsgC [Cronobacter turicensis]MDK1204574.1 curli assembly chaperone CsgC [Cronobacter turicensis]MDK1215368.1 curli assembly chaperone CsgC [Cronobacter turicensis]MDK1220083.1 curli assembly chaperone CsgC [Cronobacter turicensis]MDK1233367.1 curli assembly chaperone CsgC [Cronobacter turicensis]